MEDGYKNNVEAFREAEYPMLKDAIYLDHAGTTLYAKSLMEKFTSDMLSNLYGNPHSASTSSQLSTNRIEDIRLKVLRFFNADPEYFDVVFVANATAGIKLVTDAFRECDGGFSYGYHKDSHTSLVGVRETATRSQCMDDENVEHWLSGSHGLVGEEPSPGVSLFAYPAQSNMDGRRLPLSWVERARSTTSKDRAIFTLLDASAFVSTSAMDMGDASTAPDFTVLSFYKIFGFPDLGALIVRKESGSILQGRKYFGGGTVDVVLCTKEQWHASKRQSIHESLEDGTLAFHGILALDAALEVHRKLYGSMDQIARYTAFLAQKLFNGLSSLRHGNGQPVCVIHSSGFSNKPDVQMQGPVVAFNLKNSYGAWITNTEFERLASVRNFHIRSGGLCNPGGVAACLELEAWEMRNNFSAGLRCGGETDIYAGKITGVIRASLGAMSTISDVDAFISFVREFYVDTASQNITTNPRINPNPAELFVESLTIYPIKSCGGFTVPKDVDWEVRPEGLVWDREWCLIHQGTGQALSQKRHPHMALIRPFLDFQRGLLCIRFLEQNRSLPLQEIAIPLSADPAFYTAIDKKSSPSRVCGDAIIALTYAKPEIAIFFSNILGVPCTLARFPAGGSGFSTRHSKAHMQKHQRPQSTTHEPHVPGAFAPPTPPDSDSESWKRPILLSNESPILAVSRASLDVLNDGIVKSGGKPASASVFRANIVLSSSRDVDQEPYAEDRWSSLQIGKQDFQMLGSCRRCHMICVDQDTAEKNEEPFVTLAKTRRFESKIYFGSHMCHMPSKSVTKESQYPTIRVGDTVKVHDGTPSGKIETIDNLQTYVAVPSNGSKAKSIVFLVDIFGWEFKNVKLLADNSSNAGFFCYVPDVHQGDSLPPEFLNSVEPPLKTREQQALVDKAKSTGIVGSTLPPWLVKHREAVSKPLIDSFISAVRQIPGTGKVGAIGFCWGGRYAILAAHGEVDAVYACHPSLVAVPGDFEPVKKPLSLAVGDKDSLLDDATVGQIQELIAKKNDLLHELRIYEGQVHGFALRSDWSSEMDRKAMDEAEKQGIE